MGFKHATEYAEAYYGGEVSLQSSTIDVFNVALGGHPYMIDWKSEKPISFEPVPFIRQQSDQSDQPGEQSVNPEGLWRRSAESWHFGTGQEDYDRKDSDPHRFFDSQGIDPWEQFKIKLHKDTDQKHAAADTNLRLAVAGTRLYYTHGTTLDYITDVTVDTPTRTAVTGHPANASTSIVSDGFNVWTAHGTNGIYKTTRSIGAMASHITGTVSILGYVRNRVMAAQANIIYDVTALAMGGTPGALPAAHFTHPNVDFAWVDFAENNGFIYAAGRSGDKSLIYKIGIVDDATALDAPAVAGQLTDGEEVTHINGYLGNFLLICTNQGFRLAVTVEGGDLRIGALVETTSPILASEPQGRFIWFGLGNFTATHTGLGRLSTQFFTDTEQLVPAYASDLMVATQNNIQSIVTFQGIRVFTISQVGLYAEHLTRLVPSGHLDTGRITYGMTEPKIGVWLDFQHSITAAGHEILVSYDDAPYVSLGIHGGDEDDHADVTHFLGIVKATSFSFRIVLNRNALDDTEGLELHSWTFRAQPTAEPTDYIFATIFIAPVVEDVNGDPRDMNAKLELDHLRILRRERQIAKWQMSGLSYNVFLEDFQMMFKSTMNNEQGHEGPNVSCLLKMKVIN